MSWLPGLILSTIDSYLRLILTSWPAAVLLICCTLFFRHHDAIDQFIRRLKSAGPGGVETYPNVEEQQENAEPIESLKTEIAALQANLRTEAQKRLFERVYGSIFGSQIAILSKARTTPGGIPISDAISIYLDSINSNPELKSYPFSNYLNYVANAGLITVPVDLSSGNIQLTEQGTHFLDYLVSEGLNLAKPL